LFIQSAVEATSASLSFELEFSPCICSVEREVTERWIL